MELQVQGAAIGVLRAPRHQFLAVRVLWERSTLTKLRKPYKPYQLP